MCKEPSDALIVLFEDAANQLAEIADMIDCAGFDTADIRQAVDALYEAQTHLRPAETDSEEIGGEA